MHTFLRSVIKNSVCVVLSIKSIYFHRLEIESGKKKIQLKNPKKLITSISILPFSWHKTTLANYRFLQVLNLEFNLAFAENCLLCFQVSFITIPATAGFILIQLHSRFDALALTMISIGLVVTNAILFLIYPSGVSLRTNSIKLLKSLSATSNLWTREKDSCQPLKIKLGSFKIFEKAMVLTTLHLVLVWTARYILIFSRLNKI